CSSDLATPTPRPSAPRTAAPDSGAAPIATALQSTSAAPPAPRPRKPPPTTTGRPSVIRMTTTPNACAPPLNRRRSPRQAQTPAPFAVAPAHAAFTIRPFMHSKPQILCWLTCDGVHIDPGTGKHTILGVFSNIRARNFPVTHPFMVWFLTLSDVPAGDHRIRIS